MSNTEDLHGNAPDKSKVALLLIDVINDFEFEDGAKLFKNALPMARRLAALREKAKRENVPVIYVNDNFGKWQSNFKTILEHAVHEKVRGSAIVELLKPDEEEDYFVLKPKIPAFIRRRSIFCSNICNAKR
jgi:nicotinamidase-related amidase